MKKPPETITAYNDGSGYNFTARGDIPHFDGVEYVRSDIAENEAKKAYWQGSKDGAQSEREDILLGGIIR